MSGEPFESYLVKEFRMATERHRQIRRGMRLLLETDAGQALVAVIQALVQKFKDDHVFDHDADERRRLELRASIVALNTLLSHMIEFAGEEEAVVEVVEEEPKVGAQFAPSWAPTIGSAFEE